MSISHRTNRLKLLGTPSVEQLQNGRYRLTVNCTTLNSRDDWYSANKDRIFPDFGSLQSAEMSIDGLAPRVGEAYANMRLTSVQSDTRSLTNGGDYIVVLTYETIGNTFVQVKDDTTDYKTNGLRTVSRSIIAEPGTSYAQTIGESFIDHQINTETAVRCYLASYKIDDTDSYRGVEEVYFEAGILSETLDSVGSQKAKVIEAIGPDPATPSGYVLASKQESDFEGFQTNRFTFLKSDVELSRTNDEVGSQLSITIEQFNGTPVTPGGYSLANTQQSDVEGIPTTRYTFLKPSVLSRTEDKVGSQQAIVIEAFNEIPVSPSGYSLANTQDSDIEGIPTRRYTFLKPGVLSQTEDKVGSQLAIVIESFLTTPITPGGYSLANTQVSDVGGIPTKRYTFLKDDVELSRSEDKVGSQLAIVTEIFKPAANPTESGYSVARTEVSDVDGIPTKRFTFLKDDVELSRSEDKIGSQLAITTEVFKPASDPTESGYSVASIQISDVDGIPTKRFTFLKPSIISVRQNLNNGERLVSVEAFSQTTTQVEEALSEITVDHKLISKSESDYEGIKTSTYVYQIDSSYKEEYEVNGFKRIILTELATVAFTAAAIGSAAPAAVGADLFLASQSIDNGGVIKVKESVFIEAGVISVTPMEEDGFSLAASYVYVTTNAPASEMTGLITPSGVALPASVTWYEPSVQNVEGYPTYTQKVILKTVPATAAGVLVHSTQKFFTVTEPGVMGCDGNYSQSAESGAAARYPVATKAPRTYRKKATVKVYLTVSGDISEAEVAFSEEGVDWCSVAFDSFYTSEEGQAASATGSWRSFPNYLKGNTNGQAEATLLGKYAAFANSNGFGSTTYVQAGIYRVEVDKYTRSADGTQLYLKTIVTF